VERVECTDTKICWYWYH